MNKHLFLPRPIPALFLLFSILVVVLFDTMPLRFSHLKNASSDDCFVDIVKYPTKSPSDNLDIAVVGSSRMILGVNPFFMDAKFAEKGYSTRTFNYSTNGADTATLYLIVREILEKEQVDIFYVEMYLTHFLASRKERYKLYYYDERKSPASKFTDIFYDIKSKPNSNRLLSLQQAFRSVQKKIDISTTDGINSSAKSILRNWHGGLGTERLEDDRCYHFKTKQQAQKKRHLKVKKRIEDELAENYGEYSQAPNLEYRLDDRLVKTRTLFYLNKISEMIEAQGGEVVFTFVPSYLSPPPTSASLNNFSDHLPERLFLFPNRELSQDLFNHYRDKSHLQKQGGEIFTSYLVNETIKFGLTAPKK